MDMVQGHRFSAPRRWCRLLESVLLFTGLKYVGSVARIPHPNTEATSSDAEKIASSADASSVPATLSVTGVVPVRPSPSNATAAQFGSGHDVMDLPSVGSTVNFSHRGRVAVELNSLAEALDPSLPRRHVEKNQAPAKASLPRDILVQRQHDHVNNMRSDIRRPPNVGLGTHFYEMHLEQVWGANMSHRWPLLRRKYFDSYALCNAICPRPGSQNAFRVAKPHLQCTYSLSAPVQEDVVMVNESGQNKTFGKWATETLAQLFGVSASAVGSSSDTHSATSRGVEAASNATKSSIDAELRGGPCRKDIRQDVHLDVRSHRWPLLRRRRYRLQGMCRATCPWPPRKQTFGGMQNQLRFSSLWCPQVQEEVVVEARSGESASFGKWATKLKEFFGVGPSVTESNADGNEAKTHAIEAVDHVSEQSETSPHQVPRRSDPVQVTLNGTSSRPESPVPLESDESARHCLLVMTVHRWPLLRHPRHNMRSMCAAICTRPTWVAGFRTIERQAWPISLWCQGAPGEERASEERPSFLASAARALGGLLGVGPSAARGGASPPVAPRAIARKFRVPSGLGLNRKLLNLLCDLGDAGIWEDDLFAAGNCNEVDRPMEYVDVCGRWQCKDPLLDRCFFTNRTLRRWARPSVQNSIERKPSEGAEAKAKRKRHTCGKLEPFFQCDAHLGTWWSEVWRKVGVPLAAKLGGSHEDNVVSTNADAHIRPGLISNGTSAAPSNGSNGSIPMKAHRWRKCADDGDICLCVGDVRFGFPGHWASEVLRVEHGLIGCNAALFASAEALPVPDNDTRFGCECLSAELLEQPLVVPSRLAVPVKPQSVTDSNKIPDERFIKGTAYPESFRNGVRFDYASLGAGARLVTSRKGIRHAHSVLSPDKGDYMLAPCESRPWFVISLLDDIFLEHVGLVSLELFSSGFRHLQILGSSEFPTTWWRLLGEIETQPSATHQLFDVGSKCRSLTEMCWVRFIKVRALSHHHFEDTSFCALTRFQVFGSTQIDHIAQENTKQDEVDRRVEPSLAEVAHWHDIASRAAASGPMLRREGSPNSFSQDGRGETDQQQLQDETPKSPETAVVLHSRFQRPFWDGPDSAVAALRGRLAEAAALKLVADSQDSLGDVRAEEPAQSPAIASDRPLSQTFSAALNLSSKLVESEMGIGSTFRSLIATIGALRNPSNPTIAPAAHLLPGTSMPGQHGGKPNQQAARPTAKNSASTPQLVRMHNDLRSVRDEQTTLREKMGALESDVNLALQLLLYEINDHKLRVQALEEERSIPGSWWVMEAMGYGHSSHRCNLNEQEEIPTHLPLTEWQLILRWIASACTFDRVILVLLVAWNMISSRRRSRRFSPEEQRPLAPAALPQPPNEEEDVPNQSAKELSGFTISGATGVSLLGELRKSLKDTLSAPRLTQGQQHPPPLKLPPSRDSLGREGQTRGGLMARRANGRRPSRINVADGRGSHAKGYADDSMAVSSTASEDKYPVRPLTELFEGVDGADGHAEHHETQSSSGEVSDTDWPRDGSRQQQRRRMSPPLQPSDSVHDTPPLQPAQLAKATTSRAPKRYSSAARRHRVPKGDRQRGRNVDGVPHSPT